MSFLRILIDVPNRKERRFPNDKKYIDIAANVIALKLDELGAKKDDLVLCGGACGGDLLFAEACLDRGLNLEIRIPFDEPTFLRKSVTFAGDVWRNRFYKVRDNPNTKLFIMPEELGDPPKCVDAYARNNLWQLYTALAWTPLYQESDYCLQEFLAMKKIEETRLQLQGK